VCVRTGIGAEYLENG